MKEIIDVVVIADASGSMNPYYDQTIKGMVEVVSAQKDHPDTRFTIATFEGNHFNILLNMCDLREFVPTEAYFKQNYRIGGMTPLYKCSIQIMEKTKLNIRNTPLFMRPSKVACTIITDGLDNASSPYTIDDFNKMVKKLERENWKFAYIGMGEEAQMQGKKTTIKTSYATDASAKGTRDSYAAVTNFVGIVRGE